MRKLLLLFGIMAIVASCGNDHDENWDSQMAPKVTLDNETGIYTVKSGRELTISPSYEHANEALFVWSIDGKIVSRESHLTYKAEKTGEVFVLLSVSNRNGTTEEELRIDVVDKEIPTISLAGAESGYKILIGKELVFNPIVTQTSISTTYKWTVNGEVVSTEKDYTFKSQEKGTFNLKFATENEDGSDNIEFTVENCTVDELPFSWTFDQTEYNMAIGRSLRLMPLDITNAIDVIYKWTMEGQEAALQEGSDPVLIFTPTKMETYKLTVTAKSQYIGEQSQTMTINVCAPEGSYYHAANGSSKADFSKVYEIVAAPGQFVGQITSGTTMETACSAAETTLRNSGYVSLGGFGGYIIVGFDHSIDNKGNYDFAVRGNSFSNSSEPGIVWVMQDENGDGIPNDTWYELKGSEYGKAETIQDYAVTYYRPKSLGMPIAWKDNQGKKGNLNLNPKYPTWVTGDSYTLRGSCLQARNEDTSGSGTYWENRDYDWGYADNYSKIDMITNDGNNYFKISDAVTYDGKPANLKYIDFIKVQVGVNAQSGWLGEISTEVLGFTDYNLTKK